MNTSRELETGGGNAPRETTAYRGYLIKAYQPRKNIYWIEKDGFCIQHECEFAEAKAIIDQLV